MEDTSKSITDRVLLDDKEVFAMAYPFCVVSVNQAASILAVHPRSIYTWVRSGRLAAYKQHRPGAKKAWRIPMWAIRDWQMQMIKKTFGGG